MQNRQHIVNIHLLTVVLILLFLYTYTTSFWKYVYGNSMVRDLTIYGSTLLLVLPILKNGIKRNSALYLLLITAVLFMLVGNQDIKHGDIYYLRGVIPMLLFAAVPKASDNWIKIGIRFVTGITMLFTFFTIWFWLDPGFYKANILPIFDKSVQQQLLYSFNRGASAGIAKHYSLNGTYLAEGILALASMYIAAAKNKIRSKHWLGVCFLFILFALFLTGKRGHIVFTLLTFLFGYYAFTNDNTRHRNFKLLILASVAVIAFVILAHFVPSVALFYDRFVETLNEGDVTLGRVGFYKIAIDSFLKHPLFGIGWGGFKYINTAYAGYYNGVYANAHNVYLQLLCEVGLIGFTFFVTLMISLPIATAKLIKREKLAGRNNSACRLLFAFMMEVFVIFYSFTGNPLYDLEILCLYVFAIAITIYYQQHKEVCHE